MSIQLTDKITELASRVDHLSAKSSNAQSKALLQLRDQLTDLNILAIKLELKAKDEQYELALGEIDKSISLINNADKDIAKITNVIKRVKDAIDVAGVVVQQAADRL